MKLDMIRQPVAIQLQAVWLKLTASIGPKLYPAMAPSNAPIMHSDMPVSASSFLGPILLASRKLLIGGVRKWSAAAHTALNITKKIRLSICFLGSELNLTVGSALLRGPSPIILS